MELHTAYSKEHPCCIKPLFFRQKSSFPFKNNDVLFVYCHTCVRMFSHICMVSHVFSVLEEIFLLLLDRCVGEILILNNGICQISVNQQREEKRGEEKS